MKQKYLRFYPTLIWTFTCFSGVYWGEEPPKTSARFITVIHYGFITFHYGRSKAPIWRVTIGAMRMWSKTGEQSVTWYTCIFLKTRSLRNGGMKIIKNGPLAVIAMMARALEVTTAFTRKMKTHSSYTPHRTIFGVVRKFSCTAHRPEKVTLSL